MKYGESTFDILYLLIAIVGGFLILRRRKDDAGRLMGIAVLVLGLGDAFHLVPRVLNYFTAADLGPWLGFGKLVTSITMTVFYVIVYYIWKKLYDAPADKKLTAAVWALAAVRVILCLFPQNRWLANESGVLWGVIRNVPFVILGVLTVVLWFRKRRERRLFRNVWLYVTLSFLFYIPVAVAAGLLPILGMLMLPKTVCYVLMIAVFWKYTKADAQSA